MKKELIFFIFANLVIFLFFGISRVDAAVSLSVTYSKDPPPAYYNTPCSEVCNLPEDCWNSWAIGATDCGSACGSGDVWSKYTSIGCFETGPASCEFWYQYNTNVCSTADKYNSSNPPVMNAGFCACTIGGGYKTCCSGITPVAAIPQDIDPYLPPEASCPGGSTTLFCGYGGYPTCGQPACNTLASTPSPTSTPGGPTPTSAPTPTPPPYVGGVCTPEDLINGSLSVPSGNVTSPVTVSGSYSGNRCANFTADPNQSYLAVDCTDVWNCPDSNRYPFSAISNDSFSKTLTLSPGTHKVSAHIEGYCPQWEKNAVAALPPNEPNCNRNFTVVAPTPTPSPPTLSNLKCSCPLPSNIAYLSWSATGAYTDFYYIVKETTGTWPASWQKTNIPSGDWPTTAGKSYQWLLSGCNGSSCSATYAIGPVCDCLAASQPPKPQISTPACITGNIPPTASTVKISWTNNATPVSWVDISEDNFSSAFHKDVTSSSLANSAVEVSAPVGFNGYLNIYGLLTVKPNQNYFVRTFNGSPVNNGHSPIASFNIPLCGTTPTPAPTSTPPPASPTSTPTPAPTAAPTAAPGAPASPEVDAVCGGTSATLTLNRPSGTTYYQVTINSVMIAPSFPALTDPIIFSYGPTGRGLTYLYFVAACNAAKLCSAPTSGNFTCSNAITPWIFVDGDVHSNTGINTPGGP